MAFTVTKISRENSWVHKLVHAYTLCAFLLLTAWIALFCVNFVYPYLAAPDFSEEEVHASAENDVIASE